MVWINEHIDGATSFDIMNKRVKVEKMISKKRKDYLDLAA